MEDKHGVIKCPILGRSFRVPTCSGPLLSSKTHHALSRIRRLP